MCERVALLKFSSRCYVTVNVLCIYLTVPCGCSWISVFPGHDILTYCLVI